MNMDTTPTPPAGPSRAAAPAAAEMADASTPSSVATAMPLSSLSALPATFSLATPRTVAATFAASSASMIPSQLSLLSPPLQTAAGGSAAAAAAAIDPSPVVKYYAYHSRAKPKPPPAPRRPSAPSLARSAMLASFDADSYSEGSSDSDSSSSSSDSRSSQEDEKKERKAAAPSKSKTVSRAPAAAAAAAVPRSAGQAVTPASSSSSSQPNVSSPSLARVPSNSSNASAATFAATAASASAQSALNRAARLKVIHLLQPLLGATVPPLVERALFQKHAGVTAAYNTHVRDLVSSLRLLPSGSAMLAAIALGAVTPEQLVAMSSKELASEDLRKLRQTQEEELMRSRQKPKEDFQSVATLRDQRREETDSKQLEAAIHLYEQAASRKGLMAGRASFAFAPTTPTSAAASVSKPSPPTATAASSSSSSAASASVLPRLAKPSDTSRASNLSAPPKGKEVERAKAPAVTSIISSDSDMSDDDELLIIDSGARPAAAKPKVAPRTAAVATATKGTDSLKRKAPTPAVKGSASTAAASSAAAAAAARPAASSLKPSTISQLKTASAAAAGLPPAKRLKPTDAAPKVSTRTSASTAEQPVPMVEESRAYTPTPPPVDAGDSAAAASSSLQPEEFVPELHPTDPLQLPVRDVESDRVASYSGQLSFAFPRRGELFVSLHPLPTRDLFPATMSGMGPSSTAMLKSRDANCWSYILPSDLNTLQKMRVTELERYIRFKASSHAQAADKGHGKKIAPSASIQAASRLFPVSFTMRSTEPLLDELMRDVSTFHRTNKLALAVDFESSSIPPARQCVLWLIPPHSLHYLTDTTAREVLHWTSQPRPDEWWGILWLKAFAWRSMRKTAEAAHRKANAEMDVPSDGEDAEEVEQSAAGVKEPVVAAAAAVAAGTEATLVAPPASDQAPATSNQVLQLIQDPSKVASTANYLNSLLNKMTTAAPPSTAAVATAPVTSAPVPAPTGVAAALAPASSSSAPSLASIIASIRSTAMKHQIQLSGGGGVPAGSPSPFAAGAAAIVAAAPAPPVPAPLPPPIAVAPPPMHFAPPMHAAPPPPVAMSSPYGAPMYGAAPLPPPPAQMHGWQPPMQQPQPPPPPPMQQPMMSAPPMYAPYGAPPPPIWQPQLSELQPLPVQYLAYPPAQQMHGEPQSGGGGWQTSNLQARPPVGFAPPAAGGLISPPAPTDPAGWQSSHLQSTVHPSRAHVFAQQEQPPRW